MVTLNNLLQIILRLNPQILYFALQQLEPKKQCNNLVENESVPTESTQVIIQACTDTDNASIRHQSPSNHGKHLPINEQKPMRSQKALAHCQLEILH